MQCRDCLRSKFDREGRCTNCGMLSYEAEDALKKFAYEAKKKLKAKKREGKL